MGVGGLAIAAWIIFYLIRVGKRSQKAATLENTLDAVDDAIEARHDADAVDDPVERLQDDWHR